MRSAENFKVMRGLRSSTDPGMPWARMHGVTTSGPSIGIVSTAFKTVVCDLEGRTAFVNHPRAIFVLSPRRAWLLLAANVLD